MHTLVASVMHVASVYLLHSLITQIFVNHSNEMALHITHFKSDLC